jgi:DNA-binding CsgD family transcriptional regulator
MSATATALLEREQELAEIGRLLDGLADSRGGLLSIEGEAGAGKTSLLDAGAELAQARGVLVLRARGGQFERDFAYGVVRQLFEPLLDDPARRKELLSEGASPAAPIFEPGSGAGDVAPFGVQHGLQQLVVALGRSSPLVLAVDDAQWADVASLSALAYVARRLDGVPVGLALTVRRGEPDAPARLLDELRGEPGCTVIVPPPLSDSAAAALIEAEIESPADATFAGACREATAGNPFLLVHLLRALDVEEAGAGDGDVGRLAEMAAAGASRAVLARLARLGEHATRVARAVAVLEPNAELRLLAELAGLPLAAVAETCERLVLSGLLFDAQPVAFVHPLVRAAVLGEMPAPRRASDHARAAHLLAEDGAGADTIASHLQLAAPSGDRWAVGELRSAAAAALGRGAPASAVSYLRRALREPPAKEDRPETSRELGTALLRADDPEGIEVLRAVRGALGDPLARAEIAVELSPSLGMRGPGAEGTALLEESLTEIPDRSSELGLYLRGQLLFQALYGLEGVSDGALPQPGEALDASVLGGRFVLIQAAVLHALGLGPMERARELAEWALLDRKTAVEDASQGFPPALGLGVLLLADAEVRVDWFQDMVEASRRRGALPGASASLGLRAFCRFTVGDLDRAQEDAEAALALVRPIGLRTQIAVYLMIAARTLVARGEVAVAQRLFDDVWQGAEPGPGIPGALLLVTRGELRSAAGKHAEARHDFLAAADRLAWLPYANPELLGWRTGLALAESALGNDEEARRLAAEAVSLAEDAGGARGVGVALRVQGVVAGAGGVELLQHAADVLAGTQARLQHAYALADLGAALRRANRRREAREPLREALDLAHGFGAATLEERARVELEATGARPRKAVFTGVESLTPSELRVARMAAEGLTNREIARSLTVTAKTVETHMRHVFQKLDVARRTELAGVLTRA